MSVSSPGLLQYRESQAGLASVRPGKRKGERGKGDMTLANVAQQTTTTALTRTSDLERHLQRRRHPRPDFQCPRPGHPTLYQSRIRLHTRRFNRHPSPPPQGQISASPVDRLARLIRIHGPCRAGPGLPRPHCR